jgi:hypothetical protein
MPAVQIIGLMLSGNYSPTKQEFVTWQPENAITSMPHEMCFASLVTK